MRKTVREAQSLIAFTQCKLLLGRLPPRGLPAEAHGERRHPFGSHGDRIVILAVQVTRGGVFSSGMRDHKLQEGGYFSGSTCDKNHKLLIGWLPLLTRVAYLHFPQKSLGVAY